MMWVAFSLRHLFTLYRRKGRYDGTRAKRFVDFLRKRLSSVLITQFTCRPDGRRSRSSLPTSHQKFLANAFAYGSRRTSSFIPSSHTIHRLQYFLDKYFYFDDSIQVQIHSETSSTPPPSTLKSTVQHKFAPLKLTSNRQK